MVAAFYYQEVLFIYLRLSHHFIGTNTVSVISVNDVKSALSWHKFKTREPLVSKFSYKCIFFRLSRIDRTFTCQLMVRNSGTVTASTSIVLYNYGKNRCNPSTTTSDRGIVFWGSAASGATVQSSCPYGGLQYDTVQRSCYNGSWGMPDLSECIFRNRITRTLQGFYNVSWIWKLKHIIFQLSGQTCFPPTRDHKVFRGLNYSLKGVWDLGFLDFLGF